MENTKRVRPLAKVAAIWDKDSVSEYPETVRLTMEDGHVATYRLEIEQPGFVRALEIIRNPKGCYQFRRNKKAPKL